jgi:hypothetical protein
MNGELKGYTIRVQRKRLSTCLKPAERRVGSGTPPEVRSRFPIYSRFLILTLLVPVNRSVELWRCRGLRTRDGPKLSTSPVDTRRSR